MSPPRAPARPVAPARPDRRGPRLPARPATVPGAGSPTQRQGYRAEQRALDYLLSCGLRLVARNFRARVGELDLVMTDGEQLVVVEVRRRASADYGGAAASVTVAKRARLRRTAQTFLAASFGARPWPPLRFDVLAIDGERIDWIRAAF